MTEPRALIVVGGGVAGVAAAWWAARAGWRVTCVFEHGGASALGSGALGHSASTSGPRRADVHAFSDALGLWDLDPETRVVSSAGVVLHVAGRDAALSSLGALAGKRVALLDVPRVGWDAPWLARALSEVRWCQQQSIGFESRRVDTALDADELVYPDADLAERLTEPDRWTRFAAALRAEAKGVDAWLVGPWLVAEPRRGHAPDPALGAAIGEVASPIGGAAGLRWERARDALLGSRGVEHVASRALGIEQVDGHWEVETATAGTLGAAAVVVAVGGVAGGGVWLRDEPGAPAFECSVRGPLAVSFGDDRRFQVATAALDVQHHGAAVLERVGVRPRDVQAPALAVAGDVVFDQPRDVLTAVSSGIEAAMQVTSA